MNLSNEDKQQFLVFQRNEITECHIYRQLAETAANPANRAVLLQIANDELRHYNQWKTATQTDVEPCRFTVWKYVTITRLLGLTFGVKLMEAGEENAKKQYGRYEAVFAPARQIADEENDHEKSLIDMLDEEHLQYTGSIVLGLNDALVELTGALAGLTFALQNTKLIALTGAITGIAAAFSMAASEYLSTKSEKTEKHPVRASIYTGTAYIITVLLLIAPYLLFKNYFVCLGITLGLGIGIIAAFNYYVSIAKDLPFRKRFLEMAGLSLGVATISFLVGVLLRKFTGIEI